MESREELGSTELMSVVDEEIERFFRDAITDDIVQLIKKLGNKTDETCQDLCIMQQEQAIVSNFSHECTKLNIQLQVLATKVPNHQNIEEEEKIRRQKEELEQAIGHQVANLKQLWVALTDKLKDTIAELTTLQSSILNNELMRWKQNQQSAGNGAPFDNNLDCIEKWCLSLVDLVWRNREQIKIVECLTYQLSLDYPGVQEILPALSSQITQLLSSLVTSTFVIAEQPSQVIKTNTRFTSTVRLLVGKGLNVHLRPPQVKVSIMNEAQANALLKCGNIASALASGEIVNNAGTMEYEPEKQQLFVRFSSMQVTRIIRAERRGVESVTNGKYTLLFQSEFEIGHTELVFHVWTLSLPVIVTVHGSQEPQAWATITWDNAFAKPGRVPFAVPDTVPWAQVAETLNIKFQSATGRPLTNDSMKFVAEKALRSGDLGSQDYSGLLLSWAQFCKDPLPGRSFTFWDWFYAIMKLTGEYLRDHWTNESILGFIQKNRAKEILARCPPGTFLLRFSDSQLGAITLAFVGNKTKVFMLQPYNSKDLTSKNLAHRISEIPQLTYLYPDMSRHHGFSKDHMLNAGQAELNNGYVDPITALREFFMRWSWNW